MATGRGMFFLSVSRLHVVKGTDLSHLHCVACFDTVLVFQVVWLRMLGVPSSPALSSPALSSPTLSSPALSSPALSSPPSSLLSSLLLRSEEAAAMVAPSAGFA